MDTAIAYKIPQKKKYQRYHTDLKLHFRFGGNPDDLTIDVPKSTLHEWKHQDFSDIAGQIYGLSPQAGKSIFLARQFLQDKPAQMVYEAFCKITSCYQLLLISVPNVKKIMDNAKNTIVKTIQAVHSGIKHLLPLSKITESFGISVDQFYRWKNDKPCPESLFNKCLKTYPFQLLKSEVNKIKNILTDETRNCWYMNSLYWYLIRKENLFCSLGTFYKYAKKLGITRILPKNRRKNHEKGLRAVKANQIWHADVTEFVPENGEKVYIYFITDNFSRMILSWRVSLKLSMAISLDNLQEAYTKFRHLNPDPFVDLIVDGGSENNNVLIDSWPPIVSQEIRKLIALKNIRFSNNMAESTNRIMKYVYLYKQKLENPDAVINFLEFAVPDNNEFRPHNQLNGLTPIEVFYGKSFDKVKFHENIIKANRIRIEINRKTPCAICDVEENMTKNAVSVI